MTTVTLSANKEEVRRVKFNFVNLQEWLDIRWCATVSVGLLVCAEMRIGTNSTCKLRVHACPHMVPVLSEMDVKAVCIGLVESRVLSHCAR